MSAFGKRLYSGQVSYDFIGRRKRWFIVAGVLLLVAIAALGFRGLNLGIEFRGGADFTVPSAQCSVPEARSAVQPYVGGQPIVTVSAAGTVRVQTEPVTPAVSQEITQVLGSACAVAPSDIKSQVVGPTWGGEISSKALQGVVIFLVLVMLFLSVYFDWRMAIGALVALIFDLVVTIGVYSLTSLEVTPATVIGLLTILAYSLYDTVVVFDKVKENTRGIAGQSVITFPEAANLAVNQTVIRSVNTSIVALLPVLAIIVVGGWFLGAGTLLDLAVVLAVGLIAGTFSSIFIATPILVELRSRQPEMKSLESRVHARRVQAARATKSDDGDEAEAPEPGVVTLKADRVERQQPKRASRSKRGKSR
jgi:preprotein translocase subunit SecF